jgi:hypothetical protein
MTRHGVSRAWGSTRLGGPVERHNWLGAGGERAKRGCGPHGLEWAEMTRSARRGCLGHEGFRPWRK